MANVGVAYILWFFGGIFGLHHVYLGRDGQALIWWLSWGGYILGWLGDSGRISEFVAEANETLQEKRKKLKDLKKLQPKPELNYVTIGSYFMIGHLLSSVIVSGTPNTLLKAAIYGPFLTHLLVTLGTATGIYIISNTGPSKSSFLWPFLAAMCLFPVTYIFPEKQPISVVLTTALGAYVSMEYSEWRDDVSKQDGFLCTLKRLAVVLVALLLHGSLWTSNMYFNVHVTSMNGTQVPLREVMYNFMVTKPFEQTRNAMMDLYPCMRMYNFDICQNQFIRTLTELSDPTREDWAFKVLEFEDGNLTPRKIHSHCRKLSSKFHPDRHRNVGEKEKLEIEKKFIEIQQACGILNKIKMNRERKSTWSETDTENWSKDERTNRDSTDFDNDPDDLDNEFNGVDDNFGNDDDDLDNEFNGDDDDFDNNHDDLDNEFDEELDNTDSTEDQIEPGPSDKVVHDKQEESVGDDSDTEQSQNCSDEL